MSAADEAFLAFAKIRSAAFQLADSSDIAPEFTPLALEVMRMASVVEIFAWARRDQENLSSPAAR